MEDRYPKIISRMQKMPMLWIVLSFWGVLTIGGCVGGPLPLPTKVVGQSLKTPSLSLEVGHTTKNEVVRAVGPPTAILKDENVFLYFWNSSDEWAFVRLWQVDEGFLRFDEKDVLSGFKLELSNRKGCDVDGKEVGKLLLKWLLEQKGKDPSVHKKEEKVSLLMRTIGIVNGELDTNIANRVGLSMANFETSGCLGSLRRKSIGKEYKKNGWILIETDPGNLYLSITTGGTNLALPYGLKEKIWRVDVPPGIPLIYIGTFKIIGESKYKGYTYFVRPTYPPELLDESDKAKNVTKEVFPEKPEPVTHLAVEHVGPLILTSPSDFNQPDTDYE